MSAVNIVFRLSWSVAAAGGQESFQPQSRLEGMKGIPDVHLGDCSLGPNTTKNTNQIMLTAIIKINKTFFFFPFSLLSYQQLNCCIRANLNKSKVVIITEKTYPNHLDLVWNIKINNEM